MMFSVLDGRKLIFFFKKESKPMKAVERKFMTRKMLGKCLFKTFAFFYTTKQLPKNFLCFCFALAFKGFNIIEALALKQMISNLLFSWQ